MKDTESTSIPMHESTRDAAHPTCFVCGKETNHGLGLDFQAAENGGVEATFQCQPLLEGYPSMLHGGFVCMLLDGAMTHSLFARGLIAVTVDIKVSFRKPVNSQGTAVLRARVDDSTSSLFFTSAELLQDGEVKATAKGRFTRKPGTDTPEQKQA